ncbi:MULTISPECIES: hypothetical protein [unclassified Flavobacterium]|uniref:hypothetical protein n=1 Tax=unclassified Flavobacterium TaxID=196869 RepID=UPI001292B24D|nr:MULTISPECIES: hypothetical protein [unclassified Flavobacterium]MQP51477.1 hypothetical protein [Flavobacterium sp. LMO9]MQP61295.1 hypothetical protein [Flavobacterium sp. LMO6]
MKIDFRLYSDSTYIFKRIYEFDSIKNETFEGNFKLLNDTLICYGDFNFNGLIKNNFIESNQEYEKYEIINSKIKSNIKIDFKKFPTYTTFAFGKSKKYNRFNETAIPYELTENDLIKIDSILPICMNKTSYFKGVKKTDNYSKQCVATKNRNDEIEVWINCACSGIAKESFKYFIGAVYDGGHCFFRLKINLTTKECFDVVVNGY